MKYFFRFAVVGFLIVAGACQQKSGEHHHDSDEEIQSPNHALYEEVMAIHDEVMPRMNDLHRSKTALKKQLENNSLSEGEKSEIAGKITRIDLASEGMMVWMRQFDPIPDSLGEDKARQYLESEMVRVKKVKEDILAALKDAEPAN